MTEELHRTPAYRNRLAGSLSALMNLWWSPSFHATMVEASGQDLSPTEARLLWELGHLGAARPRDLVEKMEMGAPGITKAIAKLRSRGLVTQEVAADDRRGKVVELTGQGRDVTQHLYDVGDTLVERITGDWSPNQLEAFADLMASFVAKAGVATDVTTTSELVVGISESDASGLVPGDQGG